MLAPSTFWSEFCFYFNISLFMKQRCSWPGDDPVYMKYHDTEWGVPVHDDKKLFEFLVLEGAQAGLSWITILKKRQNYRKLFDNFDYQKVAEYDQDKIDALLSDSRIIRNRLKIESAVNNARVFISIRKKYGSFDSYIWQFVNGRQIINKWEDETRIPSSTKKSVVMSRELKKLGFKFTGPKICYAFMQAVGMVNDHTVDCFRYKEINDL